MLEKLRKSKQELQEQINKNNELIQKYDRNARILKVNTFENKLQYFLGINFFLYWIPVFIMLLNKMPGVLGLSPFQSFPLVTIGSTLAVSIPLTIRRNNKASKLLSQISNTKTQKEILLEKTKYELEIEKLNNKNKAMEKAIQTISKEENSLNDVKGKYEVKEIKKEENNIDQTILSLKEIEQELDTISTKKFINKKFSNIRKSNKFDKFEVVMDNCVRVLMPVTVITLTSTAFPYSLIGSFHSFSAYHNVNSMLAVLAPVFIPLILSTTGSALYIKNLSNKEKKVFRKLNSTLGKDALAKTESNNEVNLEKELDSKIEELSNTIIEEKKAQRNLECIANEKIEQTKATQPINQYINSNGLSEETIDYTSRTDGPTLVKR